ncbi:MAG: hypothetical protein ACI8X5_001551 [Planctomycetota bacterium]|jgi:hypothetical protein
MATCAPIRAQGSSPASLETSGLVEGSFRVERGAGVSLWVPPGEVLEFDIDVDLGVIGDVGVGAVTMSSGVEPFVAGLPVPGQSLSDGGAMVGWVQINARGGHLGYELDHTISTRYLPQKWPSLIHSEEQKGSENRKRETKVGVQEGAWKLAYRANGHCNGCKRKEHFVEASMPWNDDYHCKKCRRGEHRQWNPASEREVPEQTTDILTAVYLARGLVRGTDKDIEMFMLQKYNLWSVKLTRGSTRDIKVPAGTFRCTEVLLSVSKPKGEPEGKHKFSGLFGIKGALKIWLHEATGVPVLIEGDVPIGSIIDLHATISLAKYRGTPVEFKTRP